MSLLSLIHVWPEIQSLDSHRHKTGKIRPRGLKVCVCFKSNSLPWFDFIVQTQDIRVCVCKYLTTEKRARFWRTAAYSTIQEEIPVRSDTFLPPTVCPTGAAHCNHICLKKKGTMHIIPHPAVQWDINSSKRRRKEVEGKKGERKKRSSEVLPGGQ